MPACHAGGHEFESRTHRKNSLHVFVQAIFCLLHVLVLWLLAPLWAVWGSLWLLLVSLSGGCQRISGQSEKPVAFLP